MSTYEDCYAYTKYWSGYSYGFGLAFGWIGCVKIIDG